MAEPGIQVTVHFPPEVPAAAQGPALLQMELTLRTATKLDIRVVKALQEDDSKLRRFMTIKQREAL